MYTFLQENRGELHAKMDEWVEGEKVLMCIHKVCMCVAKSSTSKPLPVCGIWLEFQQNGLWHLVQRTV